MRRREFIALMGASVAWPFTAEAQLKVHRVALVFTTAPVAEMAGPEPVNPYARVFVRALRALGYVEGQNLILYRRSAEGQFSRYHDIIAELIQLKTEVIQTGFPAVHRAEAASITVPIVSLFNFDPVEEGLVSSLARPGGNITGFTLSAGPEIDGKRIALLKEILPGAARIAYLGTNEDWEGPSGKIVRAAAQVLGLTVVLAAHTPTEYADAFNLLGRVSVDALFVSAGLYQIANRRLIVDFARQSRLPDTHAYREAVELGALMSYGADGLDLIRRSAGYVDKILKGTKPADLPIEQPTKYELVINLKTADVCFAGEERKWRGLAAMSQFDPKRASLWLSISAAFKWPDAYSITSSARASSEGGTVRPSAFAVLRLMTRSNLVGCWIGRSAGFAPLRIWAT
jgi:putative ABC transport system substrate-binding protein